MYLLQRITLNWGLDNSLMDGKRSGIFPQMDNHPMGCAERYRVGRIYLEILS